MNTDNTETSNEAGGFKATFRSASIKGLFGSVSSIWTEPTTASTATKPEPTGDWMDVDEIKKMSENNAKSTGEADIEEAERTEETTAKSKDESDSEKTKAKSTTASEASKSDAPKPKEKSEENAELDLVFVVDNTGSMGSWIHSAQQNVLKIIQEIVVSEACDVRFALVSYRDHPPQDHSFVTQTHDFTRNVPEVQRWVDEMVADGGGDGPEAVADGLFDALNLSYRPNSTKVVVLIADAPPHGLGMGYGDGFPNGCPLGHDPLAIVREMAGKGITIYSVICGNFEGQAFYQGIAQMTGGQYVPIASSHLLAGVITGGAREEIDLGRLMENANRLVETEEAAAGRELNEDELATRLQEMFNREGATARQTRFGGAELPGFEASAAVYSAAPTLGHVRGSGTREHLERGGYGGGIDTAPAAVGSTFAAMASSSVSYAQCKRVAHKSKTWKVFGKK